MARRIIGGSRFGMRPETVRLLLIRSRLTLIPTRILRRPYLMQSARATILYARFCQANAPLFQTVLRFAILPTVHLIIVIQSPLLTVPYMQPTPE